MDNTLRRAIERHGRFLAARQYHGGWVGAWYLPSLRTKFELDGNERDTIKLSHNTSPACAQVLLRIGVTLADQTMIDAAGRFARTLGEGECDGGGWPLYMAVDQRGRITPNPSYWDTTDAPPRGIFKNGCTTNSTLFLLMHHQLSGDSASRNLAERGIDFVCRAQDANPLGLWANTHPLRKSDDPFGNCAAGLADDAGTPSAMCLLHAIGDDVRLHRAADRVADLFIDEPNACGWARYYDYDGNACDARPIERATNVETRTAVELIDALLRCERHIDTCRRWADDAVARRTIGWHKLYDRATGRPVNYIGRPDRGIDTELTLKVATILLKLHRATGKAAYLQTATAVADWLIDAMPASGWWATGYDAQTGDPLSYDWRVRDWIAPHDAMIGSTPLGFLQQLAITTGNMRYQQAADSAALRLADLQLDCGAWAFAYEHDSNQPAGAIRIAHDTRTMHECQMIYCSESGLGSQIIAWELLNTLAVHAGAHATHDWQTCYGLPPDYLHSLR